MNRSDYQLLHTALDYSTSEYEKYVLEGWLDQLREEPSNRLSAGNRAYALDILERKGKRLPRLTPIVVKAAE